MKVLHLIDSGGLYGAEVMLLNLMQEQAKLGIEPILASIGSPAAGEKEIEREAKRLGLRCEPFRFRAGPNLLGAYEVLSFGKKEKINILHSHGYKGNILFGFLPRIVRSMPIVTTVHGWTWTGGMTRMMVYEWLDSHSLSYMDRVVLVNEAMKDHSRIASQPGLALEIVPNGIQIASVPDKQVDDNSLIPEIIDFCRTGYIIGAIGRLSPEKGFDLLIKAVADLVAEGEDIRLLLLGEGGLHREFKTMVQELGLENRVLMPGYVQNARNYFPFLDLFVLPSRTEGLPLVLLETMQAGVPVVASAVGGIPNVLQGDRCGKLIKPGSLESLLSGIKEVMNDPAKAVLKTKDARQRVTESFSSRAMAEKYRGIYEQVIQCSHPELKV